MRPKDMDSSALTAGPGAQALFARRLRDCPVAHARPLKAVAADRGVSISTVGAWEAGRRLDVTVLTAVMDRVTVEVAGTTTLRGQIVGFHLR